MTTAELASLKIGDTVLGAFHEPGESTVLEIKPTAMTRAGYPYREANLTWENYSCWTRLRAGGPEAVAVKK